MSIAVNANTYSNAVNTYNVTANVVNQTSVTEEVKPPNIDTLIVSDVCREKIIKDPHVLMHDYRNYFTFNGSPLSADDKLFYYEKARDEILKTFENDSELSNAHIQALDEALGVAMTDVARRTSLYLWAQNCMAKQYESEGVKFESHKLAANANFNKDEFAVNANKILQNLTKEFLNNIKTGQNYADAKNSAFEYMAENFKTTSVNNLSLSDLFAVGKNAVDNDNKRCEGKAANIAQWSKINRQFNESKELSAELQALLR